MGVGPGHLPPRFYGTAVVQCSLQCREVVDHRARFRVRVQRKRSPTDRPLPNRCVGPRHAQQPARREADTGLYPMAGSTTWLILALLAWACGAAESMPISVFAGRCLAGPWLAGARRRLTAAQATGLSDCLSVSLALSLSLSLSLSVSLSRSLTRAQCSLWTLAAAAVRARVCVCVCGRAFQQHEEA